MQQQSKAFDKLTDRVEDRQLDSTRVQEAVRLCHGHLDRKFHFQKNNEKNPMAVIAAFNSQLPGTKSIAATLFSATPAVPDVVLHH
ncbi:Germin-like protein subfamily 2 member 4 [Linum perenne]